MNLRKLLDTIDYAGDIPLFMGDFTYINYKDGDVSKYIVFDKEGKITAQSKDNESSEIICGGDGFYMVKIMERSIDVSQDTYGILNAQGKWLLEPTENLLYSNENGWGWMLEGGASYSYIGEGFFCAKWTPNTMGRNIPLHVIYNAKTDCWWDLYYDDSQESVILGAYNGSLIWEYTDIYGGYVYATDGEGNSQEIGEVGYASEFKYQDGLIHMTDDDGLNQYIDTEGRVIADYGGYVVITAFLDDNGRAAAVVYGKDSKCYLIGIIDDYKASSFDPIVIDATKEINFSDGVISTYLPDDSDNKKYINVKGEILDDYPVNNDNTTLFWWNYNSGFTNEQDEYICAFI